MPRQRNLIFIHGLEGSSQGVKATLLRGHDPDILTPDFRGSLEERMETLEGILKGKSAWTIIGSSFGGLMGAMFTCKNPLRVEKLILLAPALIWPDFVAEPPGPVAVPTWIYHGKNDRIIPLEAVRELAVQVFSNLNFEVVEDDHGLYKTVHDINWYQMIG
jgi:pimeloyl-ACP methyl ester carboxylesterase